MSENKDKKINLLKQMKDEGLITEQEYNEKIAIVEKEKKENKKTKQTTTKNNKKAKEKDASPNNEQATEEKEQGFWKQVKKQLKEDKGCFFGMNAIECFLYSTIVSSIIRSLSSSYTGLLKETYELRGMCFCLVAVLIAVII